VEAQSLALIGMRLLEKTMRARIDQIHLKVKHGVKIT